MTGRGEKLPTRQKRRSVGTASMSGWLTAYGAVQG
jgi:hypothetical protein